MTVKLYIKTHNKTGLKYFGKTVKDINKYQGSGKYWLRHIKKHGYDVTTKLYAEFNINDCNITDVSLDFSEENDIVKSKEWANLIFENGLDGGAVRTGMRNSKEHNLAISKANSRKHSDEHKRKNSESKKGLIPWNKGKLLSKEHIQKLRDSHKGQVPSNKGQTGGTNSLKGKKFPKVKCPHCHKMVGENSKNRYHFSNCKFSLISN